MFDFLLVIYFCVQRLVIISRISRIYDNANMGIGRGSRGALTPGF